MFELRVCIEIVWGSAAGFKGSWGELRLEDAHAQPLVANSI